MPIAERLPSAFTEHPAHRNFIDMTGKSFGRLTILGYAGHLGKWGAWWWRCECGVIGTSHGHTLRQGDSRSCGCLQRELTRAKFTTHGKAPRSHRGDDGHPLYWIWAAMIARCSNARDKRYPGYGGRGISVCERWRRGDGDLTAFECFLSDMGEKPSARHSIGRIDNDGNYEPTNCRWETQAQQLANRRPYKKREDAGRPRSW